MALRLQLDPSGIVQGAATAESALDKLVSSASKTQAGFKALGASGAELDKLKRAYDPAYASALRLEKEVTDLNAAMKAGVIDAQTYAANFDRLEGAARGLDGVSGAAGRVASTSILAGNNTKMLAMQLSQVAQQSMAGGGFLRALAIQLPDIGMAFGTVGIAVGVLAGVGLPLLESAFGSSKIAADEVADATDRIGDSIGVLKGITADFADGSLEDLRKKYGEVDAELMQLIGHQREQAISAGMAASRDAIRALSDEFGLASGQLNIFKITGKGVGAQMADDLNLSKNAFVALQNAMDAAASATTFDQMTAALAQVDAILAGSALKGGELASSVTNAALEMRQLEAASGQAAAATGAVAKGMDASLGATQGVSAWAEMANANIAGAAMSADDLANSNMAAGIAAAAGWAQSLWQNLTGAAATARAIAANPEQAAPGTADNLRWQYAQYGQGRESAVAETNPLFNPVIPAIPNVGGGGGGGGGAAQVERTRDAFDDLLASLDPVVAQQQKMADAQNTVNTALAAGTINAGEAANALDLIKGKYDGATDAMADFKDAGANAFDRLIEGTGSLRDVLKDLIKDIGLAILKQQLLRTISGGTPDMSIGGLLMQGLFAGFKDSGGPIPVGSTAVVGEYGPELVKATANGAMVTSRANTARMTQPGGAGVSGRIEIGVSVDDDGKIKAMVRQHSLRAAQAGRDGAVDVVRRNLSGWQNQLAIDGALA